MGSVLTTGSDVLHRECPVADDHGVLARHDAVVYLIKHAVPDLPLEERLVLVGLLSRQREVPRVEHDGTGVERLLVLGLGLGHKLPVMELACADVLDGHLVLLHLPPPLRRELLCHGTAYVDDVHLLDVGLEADVGQDPVLLADTLEVLQEPIARGPGRVEHRRDGVVLIELQVVSTVLGLQLRGRVRLVHPRGASDHGHAVEDHEVRIAPLEQQHGGLEAYVPRPDDCLGTFVLHALPLEALDPADKQLGPHLVG
mmetsp:Transcript_80474/g.181594  ORF Transcript_80474/g.181594 Transcript_80474/m.181594 type:complete len:256 (-) Transcript_80474:163-930(-)